MNSTDRLQWYFPLFQTLGFTSALCVLELQDWTTCCTTYFVHCIHSQQQTVNTIPMLNYKLGIFKVSLKLDSAGWPLLKILRHISLAGLDWRKVIILNLHLSVNNSDHWKMLRLQFCIIYIILFVQEFYGIYYITSLILLNSECAKNI